MCRILGVKRANYYKWLHHEKSARDKENQVFKVLFALNEEAVQLEKTIIQPRIILTETSMHQDLMKNG